MLVNIRRRKKIDILVKAVKLALGATTKKLLNAKQYTQHAFNSSTCFTVENYAETVPEKFFCTKALSWTHQCARVQKSSPQETSTRVGCAQANLQQYVRLSHL